MKAWTLLLLRFGTGMLLVLWGIVRLTAPDMGAKVSAQYYAGGGASATKCAASLRAMWRAVEGCRARSASAVSPALMPPLA